MAEKKFLDQEGVKYLWSKISMEDYPNNDTLVAVLNAIDETKQDKIIGKGLSTNDFTTEEKNKLAAIQEGAEVNVQVDWNENDETSDAFIKNKPVPDSTLTIEGAAADAKAVGDALATKQPSGNYALKSDIPTRPSDIGAQPAGNYITTETDPTVPAWAKAATKPTYTASEVGADAFGTASSAVSAHNTNTSAHSDIRARLLPSVTASDAGKFLCVNSSGSWAASALENAEEVSF